MPVHQYQFSKPRTTLSHHQLFKKINSTTPFLDISSLVSYLHHSSATSARHQYFKNHSSSPSVHEEESRDKSISPGHKWHKLIAWVHQHQLYWSSILYHQQFVNHSPMCAWNASCWTHQYMLNNTISSTVVEQHQSSANVQQHQLIINSSTTPTH